MSAIFLGPSVLNNFKDIQNIICNDLFAVFVVCNN